MKTLYLECNMGAAGDMIMAALLELHGNPMEFLDKLNGLGIPGVKVEANAAVKHGITGTHVSVLVGGKEEISEDVGRHHHGHSHDEHTHHSHHSHEGHSHHHHDHHSHEAHSHHHHDHHSHSHSHEDAHSHSHGSYSDIEHLIGHLNVSETVKKNALGIYKLIAEAESRAHGIPVTQIHFHEVGEMDAVADIVGVCMLIESLAPEKIIASPVHVGSGNVRCAHGILPVPAPATAFILRDAPIYGGDIRGELCTPTGAAILKHFASEFGAVPTMKIAKIGYGMGKKDFERANCIRAFIGEVENNSKNGSEKGDSEVIELSCNLDDMTPEAIAFAQQLLFDEGALDVYTMPIGMKKGRTGILFTCMCSHLLRDKMVQLMFKHTTTIGIRESVSRRFTLTREVNKVQTKYGAVKVKTSGGYGIVKSKPEYDDVARIAQANGISFSEAGQLI